MSGRYLWLCGVVLTAVFCPELAYAKCARVPFTLEATLTSELPEGAQVQVFTEPDANAKDAQVAIKEGRLRTVLWFDSTRGVNWLGRHNCSRRPAVVGLRVSVGGTERFRGTKRFPGDFAESKDGGWMTATPFRIWLSDGR